MKFMILTLSLVFGLTACSSGGNNDGNNANLTPFQKNSGGTWKSECIEDATGNYFETLTLNGSSGTSAKKYFRDLGCGGAFWKDDNGNFTYTYDNKGSDTSAQVTLTQAGSEPVTVQVAIQGDSMTVSRPDNKTVRYTRIAGGPGKGPASPAMAAFDAAAKGNWMTRDCKQTGNGASYLQVLAITGGGAASTVYNVYQGFQCQGDPAPQGQATIAYEVTNFANGAGQIKINGQPIDVTIRGAQMTVSSPEGSDVYVRIQ